MELVEIAKAKSDLMLYKMLEKENRKLQKRIEALRNGDKKEE